jgi:stress-induced-phosphoprotein 1
VQKQKSSNGKVEGKTAEEWKEVGNDEVKKGKHAAAYEAYSKGIEADPDHAMILSNRALCLEKLGRLEEAVEDAKRCTVLRPDFVKGFMRAATCLIELKRPDEAMDVLRRAPNNSEVEQLLAKVKPEAEKTQKSRLAQLSGAEKLKEEGNVLFKKGFFEKALEVYTKALKACKDQKGETAVAIRNNRAGCYQQLSDFHAVVQETNFVLEQQPGNLKALLRRMLALEPLEKYEQALADARLVIQQAPGNEAANKMQHRLSKIVRDKERDVSAAGA